jgi:hypothetical protein
MPKVFVSYSHDSDAHRTRVAEFVARLRGEGIDVVYDEDLARIGGPDEGWSYWCERQIVECDYVLACCTPLFHRRFDGEPGSGVGWEALPIRQYLYENLNRKIRPLIFEQGDRDHIPNALRPFSFFVARDDRSYADLLGWLKGSMSPKVLVSYSHDSDAHKARVAGFVARLRREGIGVVYDEDLAKVGGPEEGWQRWCERQIVECDYVLACCTSLFRERFDGPPGSGVGWEALPIRQYLYENLNRKIRALIFEPADRAHIPNALRPFSFFVATDDGSYANLLGWLKAASTSVAPPPATAGLSGAAVDWPPSENFPRQMANRSSEFEHFKSVLAGLTPQRILLVQGPSGSGKTVLVNECVAYVQHQHVPYSLIDLKGAPPLEYIFETLIMDLGPEALPRACSCPPSARPHAVIADLQQLRKPLVLAFDTYEHAPQTAQNWIEILLSRIDRCPALVVAVAGQRIPEHSGRTWAPLAYAIALPPIQRVDDWIDFVGRNYGSTGVKRDHVEAVTLAMKGDPSQVSALIDALVRSLPAS